MKKILIGVLALFMIHGRIVAQGYDDRAVTQHLSVNTSESKYQEFVNGFRSGLQKVKNGEWTTMDQIYSQTGYDLRRYPRLDNINAADLVTGVSLNFVTKVKEIISNPNFTTVGEIRNALANMAARSNLSQEEAQSLACFDLATQEVVRSLMAQETGKSNSIYWQNTSSSNSLATNYDFLPEHAATVVFENDYRLPRWLRCALGIIGGAIMGGIGGAGTGATIGSAVPGVGTALGGLVGGVSGVIGGVSTAIVNFCD